MKGPDAKFKAGAVSAVIWKNTAKKGTDPYFTVNVTRNYKDREGRWQRTSILRVSDLPKAKLVLGKAYEHLMFENKKRESGEVY